MMSQSQTSDKIVAATTIKPLKSLAKSLTKSPITHKRKRSPTINNASQKNALPRKKLKPTLTNTTTKPNTTSNTPIHTNTTRKPTQIRTKPHTQTSKHTMPHTNGTSKPNKKLNGTITPKPKPKSITNTKANTKINATKHRNILTDKQLSDKRTSITKQKKLLMDSQNPIIKTFKGMWKSREAPKHLLKTNTPKPIENNQRGLKRRASGPPIPAQPSAKRQKIVSKSNKNKDEPPPLVTLNQMGVKCENIQNLSDRLLGIKPTENTLKNERLPSAQRSGKIYKTALSAIATKQIENGPFYEQDLDTLIHQHNVLRNKLEVMREDLGCLIPKQSEPINHNTPWDCMLDEVCHMANDVRHQKLEHRMKHKRISTQLRREWKNVLHNRYKNKYQSIAQRVNTQINNQFQMKINGKNGGSVVKMYRRKPSMEIAKCIKMFWHNTQRQFKAIKGALITRELAVIKPRTFLDAVINARIDPRHTYVDEVFMSELTKHYGIANNSKSAYDIKQAILLRCHSKLLSTLSQKSSECKPTRIRGGKFKCKLRDYQMQALHWLTSLYQCKMNGILSSDYGLGKTVEIIALFAWLASDKKINGPHLVIAPTQQITNWQNQFRSYYPQCNVLVYNGEIFETNSTKNKWSACIVSYDEAIKHSFQFRKIQWEYVIFDDAHEINDFSHAKWQSLFTLHCQFRLLLINKSIHDHLSDVQLWSLMHCLMPNAFVSRPAFELWFNRNVAVNNQTNSHRTFSDKLKYILSPFTAHQRKCDIKTLPKMIEKQYICPMTPRQKQLYETCVRVNGETTLDSIYKLQQICNHPNLYQKCNTDKDIFAFDPISQIEFVYHSKIAKDITIIRPQNDKRQESEKKRIEMVYKSLFHKVKDNINKINKEKSKEMDEDDSSEETEDTNDSVLQTIMKPQTIPCKEICDAMAMPLKSIIHREEKDSNSNHNQDEREAVPLDIALYCQALSQFSVQGFTQWNCSKLNALAELLDELHGERRHKIVLFVSDKRMIDILELFVMVYQYDYIRCDHDMSQTGAISLFDRFNEDKNMFVFIVSTRNVYINAFDTCKMKANTVIYYDNEWESIIHENVERFVNKMNGYHDITVYRLINQDSIEQKLLSHYQSNISTLSVSHYYSHCRNLSLYQFNNVISRIEAKMNKKSIQSFYNMYSRDNSECLIRDLKIETNQFINIVSEHINKNIQISPLQLSVKKHIKMNKFLPMLLRHTGFAQSIHTNTFINAHYLRLIKGFKRLQLRCLRYVSEFNGMDDIIMLDNTNRRRNKRRGVSFKSGPLDVSCFYTSTIGSYLQFADDKSAKNSKCKSRELSVVIKTESKNDEVQIIEKKSHKKSDKMELDEDDDMNLSVIRPKNIKKEKAYRVLNERRDTLELFDQYGDYYQHSYEPYEPFGCIVDDHNVDEYLHNAIQKSIRENENNPNYWNLYLDYDYQKINESIEFKAEERAKEVITKDKNERKSMSTSAIEPESESTTAQMQRLFKQWQETNDKGYTLHGIVPGYMDTNGDIQTCNIDPKTGAIDYGTLDDFVFSLNDPHILRLYTQEKEVKQTQKSLPPPTPKPSTLPALTPSQSVPLTKPLETITESPHNSYDDWYKCQNDPYYMDDNNVFSRIDEQDLLFDDPGFDLPTKIYEDPHKLSAFDYEIYKIKQDWLNGDRALKCVIDDFKFTPKPQQILEASPSPDPVQDPYRIQEDDASEDSEATEDSNVHGSTSLSTVEERKDTQSVDIQSPNTQKKQNLLHILSQPHPNGRKKNNLNAYVLPQININNVFHKDNADGNITLNSIHKWLNIATDTRPPTQKTPLKPFKIVPKKDNKTGAMRYDPKIHPTICSSKEIGELHHIVNSFASKLRGRRNVSWRMIKQTLKTKQNTNMRCRTRFELLQVYHKTSRQCKRKDLETLSYFGMDNTVNNHIKKQKKKHKRTAFWDQRFVELQEKKGRGNKKLFKEPIDFDDKKLNAMTKKTTKRMVKELDVCISRVVDLTPDNQNKDEHASHQQTIKSAYQKLNLIVQGQKPYAPNYIWKNHWGQLPVNPYTKPNITHHQTHVQPQHMSMSAAPPPQPTMSTRGIPPTHHIPQHMNPAHINPHMPPNMSAAHHGLPHGYPVSAASYGPHHGRQNIPRYGLPPTHTPQQMMNSVSGMPPTGYRRYAPYAHMGYPPPGYPQSGYPSGHSLPTPQRGVPVIGSGAYSRMAMAGGQPYPYGYHMRAGMPPGGNTRMPPMGAATPAQQQHPSAYRPNKAAAMAQSNGNSNNRQVPNGIGGPVPNPTQTPRAAANASTNTNMSNPNVNVPQMRGANGARMGVPIRRAVGSGAYAAQSRVGASLAGTGAHMSGPPNSARAQMLQRQRAAQAQYQAQAAATAGQYPPQRNRNLPPQTQPSQIRSNVNVTGSVPPQPPTPARNLSQPPRLEQHSTNQNGNNRQIRGVSNGANNGSKFMGSPRPSLPGTIASNNKALAQMQFKNRNKQFMNGNKKQSPPKPQQQNPFGPTTNNKMIDGDMKNETESEAHNGFVPMQSMANTMTRMGTGVTTSALPPNTLSIDQMQRDSFNSNNQQSFYNHNNSDHIQKKGVVVTNGNGATTLNPSTIPRNSGQPSSPNTVMSSNSTIASNHNTVIPPPSATHTPRNMTPNNTNNRQAYRGNTNSNSMRGGTAYYNPQTQQRHAMMNGHALRSRMPPSTHQMMNVNAANQYNAQRQSQRHQMMNGMHRGQNSNVNNLNRGQMNKYAN